MGFFEAVSVCFKKYADFSGRARRKEYWYFTLFNAIVSLALTMILGEGNIISSVFALVMMVPGLAVCWRRLHDIGKSGGWWFLWFVPLVGWIFLLVWFCRDSQRETNAYGPNPKA
ncbi:MAG: DUF805 domain-containing protein [Clostridia bacterium]|nr:DUF805 domain-containing protein [Clostridia bacterium]